MIRAILHTVFTRGAGLLAGFLLVWITARYLGAEIRGMISLFTFALALITLFSNMLGGPVLVYRASRHAEQFLLRYSLYWTIAVCLILPPFFGLLDLLPWALVLHCMIPGLLLSIFNTYGGLLLGTGRLSGYNQLTLLQAVLLPAMVAILLMVSDKVTFDVYLAALYLAYFITFIPALFRIIRSFKVKGIRQPGKMRYIYPVFRQGVQIQLASVFQLLSYRAAFWYLGYTQIGIFSVAAAIAEAVWVVSKSLATIQYSKISSSRNEHFNRLLTNLLVRISMSGTAFLLIIILLIPETTITSVFGPEYIEVDEILTWLAPGILFIAIATIITHYFSGIGRNKINIEASLYGASTAVISCAVLIPYFSTVGAAAATSLGYLVNLLFLLYHYYRKDKSIVPSGRALTSDVAV